MHILKSLRKKCLPIIIEKLWYVIGFKVRLSNSNFVFELYSSKTKFELERRFIEYIDISVTENAFYATDLKQKRLWHFKSNFLTDCSISFTWKQNHNDSSPIFLYLPFPVPIPSLLPPPPHTYTHTTRKHTKSYVLKKHYKGNYVWNRYFHWERKECLNILSETAAVVFYLLVFTRNLTH